MNRGGKWSEWGMINIGNECPKRCKGTNNHITPKYKKVRMYTCKRGFKPTVKIIKIRLFK